MILRGTVEGSHPLTLTGDTLKAFEKCKQSLCNATLLAYPDMDAKLAVVTDASDTTIGGVLQQLVDNRKNKCSPRQFRHLDFIAQFTTDIRHVSSKDNIVADTLSRVEKLQAPVDLVVLAKAQASDLELSELLANKTSLRLEKYAIHGFMSGRRKANRLFNTARDNIMRPEAKDLELDLGLVYSLGLDFPSLKLNSSQAAHSIKELMAHLEMRISRREILKRSKAIKDEKLRSLILDVEKDSLDVRSENMSLKGQLSSAERRIRALEESLVSAENSSLSFQKKLNEMTEYTSSLKRELQEKDLLLNQNKLDKEKQKKILEKKYKHKIAAEHEKAKEINSEEERLRNAMEDNENRLRIIAEALQERGDHGEVMPKVVMGDMCAQTSARDFTPGSTPRALPAHMLTPFSSAQHTRDTASSRRGVAIANPRYRRSLSAEGRGWIEHAPNKLVPMGTVMKPVIENSKNVNKLTNVKDIANAKTSKYCLISQEQDTDEELETKLYKGDVVPACGGGAEYRHRIACIRVH
ncbi:kinesin-like protein KIF23 [Battus philenor]|uniref:kinesin-like protein KIF23 n=1 Tax=Battus philenor TaxID=42288 RepID=UPI0035CEFF63